MSAFITNPLGPSAISSFSASQFTNQQTTTQRPLQLSASLRTKSTRCNDVTRTTRMIADEKVVDDKAIVTEYFNNKGFDRWNRIYSDTDNTVNTVQLDIRDGHAKTIGKVMKWLSTEKDELKGSSFCDAGCGVGSLTLPLLELGVNVNASDISQSMVEEAKKRVYDTNPDFINNNNVQFDVKDLEQISGHYDTVCCIDVMIHYPSDKAAEMIQKLAACSDKRLILSFAPKTFLLGLLKKVGEFFPGPSKATRAYLHTEQDIIKAIEKCGMKVKRTEFTGTRFYFSKLIEAVKE